MPHMRSAWSTARPRPGLRCCPLLLGSTTLPHTDTPCVRPEAVPRHAPCDCVELRRPEAKRQTVRGGSRRSSSSSRFKRAEKAPMQAGT